MDLSVWRTNQKTDQDEHKKFIGIGREAVLQNWTSAYLYVQVTLGNSQ